MNVFKVILMRGFLLLCSFASIHLLTACSSTPPPHAWQTNSHSALETTVQHYLTGNTRAEEQDYARAYKELAATGNADLLARAELTRCAARLASLVFDTCAAYQALAADAAAEQRAYAAYLAGQWEGLSVSLLPKHHAAVLANPSNPALLLQIADPLSQLVAAASMVQRGTLSTAALDQVAAIAVQTSSAQAWRRPLLAWLGLQVKQAENKNDAETLARLQRRIALIYSMPSFKP